MNTVYIGLLVFGTILHEILITSWDYHCCLLEVFSPLLARFQIGKRETA